MMSTPTSGESTQDRELSKGRAEVRSFEGRTPPPGNLAIPALAHGSMIVEYYAPRGHDRQTPHARDELYIIIAGQGTFQNGAVRHPFGPDDVLFVAAGVEHRFEDFSDDFATWVIFYGPEGGEAA